MENYKILNFHPIFSENAFCLSQRLGVEIITNFEPKEGITYILFGAHDKAADLHAIQHQYKGIKYIILNSESPKSTHLRNKYYIALMLENITFDYHPEATDYLKSLGIRVFSQFNFEFVYNPAPEAKRDIDIFFAGCRNERRAKIYENLKKRYPEKNILFDFEYSYADQSKLTEVLHRSKIVLNIPFYEHRILETHRIHKALACGCQVVSLFSGHKETDNFYEKYCFMVHDLYEYFDSEEMLPLHLTEKKLLYPKLITELAKNTQQIAWILQVLKSESQPQRVGNVADGIANISTSSANY